MTYNYFNGLLVMPDELGRKFIEDILRLSKQLTTRSVLNRIEREEIINKYAKYDVVIKMYLDKFGLTAQEAKEILFKGD